jgi:hypothetical protein
MGSVKEHDPMFDGPSKPMIDKFSDDMKKLVLAQMMEDSKSLSDKEAMERMNKRQAPVNDSPDKVKKKLDVFYMTLNQ